MIQTRTSQEGGGTMLATPSDAHREWHRNAGVPVGLPCPMDACDPELLSFEDRARLMREFDRLQRIRAARLEAIAATCPHGLSADLCAGPGHYPEEV